MGLILPLFSTILLACAAYMMWRGWRKKVEDPRDEVARLRGRLGWYHQWGWAFIILAAANIIDLSVPFPFPFKGQVSLYFSVLTAIAGCTFLILYSLPKVNETLLVASRTNGILTEALLMRELGLSNKLVEDTLRKMMRLDLVVPINQQETKLSRLIFVARGAAFQSPQAVIRPVEIASGEESSPPHGANRPEANSETTVDDSQILAQYGHIGEMDVDTVNQMLLMGSLTLGQSGRPAGGQRPSHRRSERE